MYRGWISLHRKLQDHWLWEDKPFSKGQAWIDLLISANHKEKKTLIGNTLIDIEKGSFITSEVKLADHWGWGRKKVRTFLKLLEDEEMIIKKSTTKYTSITIVNYTSYQPSGRDEEQQKNNEGTTKEQQRNTTNNVNNYNNVNNIGTQPQKIKKGIKKHKTKFHLSESRGDNYTAEELENLLFKKSRGN